MTCFCGRPVRGDRWFWWTNVEFFRYHARRCRDLATPRREDLEAAEGLRGRSLKRRAAARSRALRTLQGAHQCKKRVMKESNG